MTAARALSVRAGVCAGMSGAQKATLKEGLAAAAKSNQDLAGVFEGLTDAQLDAEFKAYSEIRAKAEKEKWDDHKLTQELYLWRVREFRAKLEKAKAADTPISKDDQADALAAISAMQGADSDLGVPRDEVDAAIKFPNKVKLGNF